LPPRVRLVVTRRAQRLQVFEPVNRPALRHGDLVVDLEAFRLTAEHAAMVVAGEHPGAGPLPTLVAVDVAMRLRRQAPTRPRRFTRGAYPSALPHLATTGTEVGQAHGRFGSFLTGAALGIFVTGLDLGSTG
jgi:hypothetical protein